MSRPSRWSKKSFADGVLEIELYKWDYFTDYVYDELLEFKTYVYRGHRRSDWGLESTLDRQLKSIPGAAKKTRMEKHLDAFKYASRGRRGPNPAHFETQNEWWALGQHFGLSTPLLDWTHSPYVAAFFAFEKIKHDDTPKRVVYALSQSALEKHGEKDSDNAIEFVRPLSDENSRLVNQNGLFTKTPVGQDVESWIRERFEGSSKAILIKLVIPTQDRLKALKELNRMNINHLTLYPDLYGTSLYCNTALVVSRY